MKSMKIIATALFAALLVLPSFAQEEQEDKIGTVSMQNLVAQFYKTQILLEKLKGYEKGILEKNNARAEENKALAAEADDWRKQAENPSITREKKQEFFRKSETIRQEVKARRDERMAWLGRKRAAFAEKQKVELGLIRKEIMEIVQEVGEADGLDFIFDRSGGSGANVAILSYAKDATDLTAKMVKRINRDAPEKKDPEEGGQEEEKSGEEGAKE